VARRAVDARDQGTVRRGGAGRPHICRLGILPWARGDAPPRVALRLCGWLSSANACASASVEPDVDAQTNSPPSFSAGGGLDWGHKSLRATAGSGLLRTVESFDPRCAVSPASGNPPLFTRTSTKVVRLSSIFCYKRGPRHLPGPAVEGTEALWGTRARGPTRPPPPTKWAPRVPHPVLIGHAASLSQDVAAAVGARGEHGPGPKRARHGGVPRDARRSRRHGPCALGHTRGSGAPSSLCRAPRGAAAHGRGRPGQSSRCSLSRGVSGSRSRA
jgi:hypothetical protein